MAGVLLESVGDVQLGADEGDALTDTEAVVLRRAKVPTASWLPEGAWVSGEFNPAANIEIDKTNAPMVHRPGQIAGPDIPFTRLVEVPIVVRARTPGRLRYTVERIMRATAPLSLDGYQHLERKMPLEHELSWASRTGRWVMYGRFRGTVVSQATHVGLLQARLGVRFEANDPLIYDLERLHAVEVPKTVSPDPVPHPVTTPFELPAGTPVTLNATESQLPPRWRLRLVGGAENPSVWWRRTGLASAVGFIGLGQSDERREWWDRGEAVFDAGERSVYFTAVAGTDGTLSTGYAEDRMTWGSSWFEVWPRVELLYAPRGVVADPVVADSDATRAYVEWRPGHLGVL